MSVPRSNAILSGEAFQKIFGLTARQPWLVRKQDELLALHAECTTHEQLELVVDLLDRFNFVDSHETERSAREIVDQVENKWDLDPENTAVVTKNIEEESDSSSAVNYLIQPQFAQAKKKWNKANFYQKLGSALLADHVRDIVIVDDFSGTGNSLYKVLKWVEGKLHESGKNKNVYACFFCVMSSTTGRKYPEVLKGLYSVRTIRRGISDHYNADVDAKIAVMKELEQNLAGLGKDYSLGYEQSEALYVCHNFNMPNNNFPIFWYDKGRSGTPRKPLFYRLTRSRKRRQ